jgi:SSS family solute:Na+ symporter
MDTPLTAIDFAILGAYALLVIAVGVAVTRRSPDSDELFLAGRSLGPMVIGLSLFASNISSTTLIGLPGAAWQSGISVANYEWMAALVLLFTAVYVAPTFIGQRLTTVPELLEQRFDGRLRRYLSATSLFLSIVLDTAGSLYAGALVMMLFVPGLSLAPTIAGLAVFAGIYTAAGGLRAVAYTDVMQSLVLLVGSTILTLLVFGEFDFSIARVVSALPEGHLSLLRPLDDPALPWLGTLIGLPILGFYYWTMNQYVAQRLLGARDIEAAGRGALLAAALKLLPLFIMVLPGAMAAVLFTDLERPDSVFPRLIAEYAPPGLAGLMLAGLLAAIMSSVDSTLNSASTLFIVDFVRPRRPQLSGKDAARLGRWCTLLLMLVAAAWAPQIDRFPGLFAYLQQTFAFVTPPLVAVFTVAMLARGVSAGAALRGTLSGHALSALAFAASIAGAPLPHFTILAGMLYVTTLLAILAWNRLDGGAAAWATRRAATAALPQPSRFVRGGAALLAALTLLLVSVLR